MQYDYKTREGREKTAALLLSRSVEARTLVQDRWDRVQDYYEGRHRTQEEIAESCRASGIPWIAAVCPDPYLHVESQISAVPPDFRFQGRDGRYDPEKAAQRAAIVRYLTDRTRLSAAAPQHERRCILCGTAVWKVFWDGEDVRLEDLDPRCLYPDPCASSAEDCEYINLVYRLHRRKIDRLYGTVLRRRGYVPETMGGCLPGLCEDDAQEDTLPVLEHWYRNDRGGIGCTVLVSGVEVNHIPEYWLHTQSGVYPFVFQYRVRNAGSLWGSSDIEPALPLVDAVDRELALAQLQSAFTGSDIILAEFDAFAEPPENRPGAIWQLKPGAMGKVQRLGDMGNPENRVMLMDSLRGMIQDAVGNYDISMGKEPTRMLSASGLSQLLEQAEVRRAPKKAERQIAYEALYRLLDLTALEFYDEGRILRLGAADDDAVVYTFRRSKLMDESGYVPEVDCIVSTADALQTGRAFTLTLLETLLSHQLTRENYPLAVQALGEVDLAAAEALRAHLEAIYNEGKEEKKYVEADAAAAAQENG